MSITFKDVSYEYQPHTPFAFRALNQVSFSIPKGSYTAIIGHTGSGKSTILQHLNGLLKPTSGTVLVDNFQVTPERKDKELVFLRKKVGIVFQFPEAQLFEETVIRDIAFGPINFKRDPEEAYQLAKELLAVVGLPAELGDRSPFDLSGGQKRRVAIAGVLALEPEVLVLDEPTAGLDPRGRHDMMELFKRLHQEQGLTIVLVTHQMDDVAQYANHVIVMNEGTVVNEGTPQHIFSDAAWLRQHHLDVPRAVLLAEKVGQQLGKPLDKVPFTAEQLADFVVANRKTT